MELAKMTAAAVEFTIVASQGSISPYGCDFALFTVAKLTILSTCPESCMKERGARVK